MGSESDEGKDGYMYYLNDGVYGSFNPVLWDHQHPQGSALLITKTEQKGEEKEKTYPSIIWGPTCTNSDEIEVCCVTVFDCQGWSNHRREYLESGTPAEADYR